MAWATHPSANEILRSPGYLFWNPTSLASEATWGTKLGFCEKGISINFQYTNKIYTGEELGEEPILRLFTGVGKISCVVAMKNFNSLNLSLLFPGLTQSEMIKTPGFIIPGSNMSSYFGKLLFVPDDTGNNPIFILQNASAVSAGGMDFSRVEDLSFICVFESFRKTNDADGRYYLGNIASGVLR